jgi:hypothetical protein
MSEMMFNEQQIEKLKNNPNVTHVSTKSITYQEHFKQELVREYENGKSVRQIFIDNGFEVEVLGRKRIQNCASRWISQSKRVEGLKDTRKENSGRPRTKDLSKDELIARQKAEIEYLKQEREFLLELKRLERQVIKEQAAKHKKNMK